MEEKHEEKKKSEEMASHKRRHVWREDKKNQDSLGEVTSEEQDASWLIIYLTSPPKPKFCLAIFCQGLAPSNVSETPFET
jgi:hypothetical protein